MTEKNLTTAQKVIVEAAASQANTVPTTNVTDTQRMMYEYMKTTIQPVGGKQYVSIPVDLLYADYRYQRLTNKGSKKILNLVAKWNPAKMDALRVSLHDEECRCAVINGMHRLIAATIMGLKYIECEIITGLPTDPEERLKAEAYIFVTQNDEVDLLKPYQKHGAGLVIGTQEYVVLDRVTRKHGIEFKKNASARGRVKAGVLAGYTKALHIAKLYGESRLDNIFTIICESRWNLSRKGFSNDVLGTINNILRLHPDSVSEIIPTCIEFMKPITPIQFIAESYAAYPERTEMERCTLYLEDYVCEKLGLTRVYMADKGIARKNAPLTVVSNATTPAVASGSSAS